MSKFAKQQQVHIDRFLQKAQIRYEIVVYCGGNFVEILKEIFGIQ